MKLDKEEHRQQLLGILKMLPLQGSFDQMQESVQKMGELIEAIEKAEIE